ncbi:GNAT family N-acetyltransferase [Chlorogloeopsis sp. ULAP01]|uniref:GNAT family N-acetyltransferase n=1 Tax=Chlorogloeopsis sp. ULAP01 TaxID=3056483 RepID=UPI0025AA8D0E|nr:GNAT family N-acetyltransferase [Chlorogloeopsis sp. ULAP01]MDM9384536.1 GNAT family N-acetyltransferase [Chlorogloeopsis sp. ULAP01]
MIELDSDNRESIRKLFDHYPCLRGFVAAVIEGDMGKVFVDSQEKPRMALSVLEFHFLAGDPLHANPQQLEKLLQPGGMVIAPTPAWQQLVTAIYPNPLDIDHREAFQVDKFDVERLRQFCQAVPSGFELRQVRLEEVTQFAADLNPYLGYNFRSHEDLMTRGVALGILHQGRFVSGASSAAVGGGKVEIDIHTHEQFRRRGLARAVAAALILYCLDRGLEPCWDAANEPSSALARQLGFRSTGKYEALNLPDDESATG